MVYLGLDPEIQTELVEQIESVVGYDRDPVCLPSYCCQRQIYPTHDIRLLKITTS